MTPGQPCQPACNIELIFHPLFLQNKTKQKQKIVLPHFFNTLLFPVKALTNQERVIRKKRKKEEKKEKKGVERADQGMTE